MSVENKFSLTNASNPYGGLNLNSNTGLNSSYLNGGKEAKSLLSSASNSAASKSGGNGGSDSNALGSGLAVAGAGLDLANDLNVGGSALQSYGSNILKYGSMGAKVGGPWGAIIGGAVGIGVSAVQGEEAKKAESQGKAVFNNAASTASNTSVYASQSKDFYADNESDSPDVYGTDQLLNANKSLLS